jgi:hypothetical protein
VTLVIEYPFSVWYVCKINFWAHIQSAFGLALKLGVIVSMETLFYAHILRVLDFVLKIGCDDSHQRTCKLQMLPCSNSHLVIDVYLIIDTNT